MVIGSTRPTYFTFLSVPCRNDDSRQTQGRIGSDADHITTVHSQDFLCSRVTRMKRRTMRNFPHQRNNRHVMIGSMMLPVSLFWSGWTADKHVHWISPIIAEVFSGCGNLLIFMSAVLYLMNFYGSLYSACAVFPLSIMQMYSGLGIGWASSLLWWVSLALTPIPLGYSRCMCRGVEDDASMCRRNENGYASSSPTL